MMHADNPHGNVNANQTFAPVPPEFRFQAGAMPREVVRWLQNIDVAPADARPTRTVHKPIKHPKRDFANGYHVARIISLATNNAIIDMNKFDDVSSAARKVQNWKELQKQLRMANMPTFSDDHIAAVMAAKDGAADDMLLMVYQKFSGRGLPGSSAVTKGGPPPAPQPLGHVPTFVKTAPASGSGKEDGSGGSSSGHHTNEATKQLSAMAAEQLRAAELELLKQKTDTDLRAEIIGAAATGGDDVRKEDGSGSSQQQQQQQQQARRHVPRAPTAPQPLVQGQIRAVDAAAESEDKAVLFNHQVSMRQLSGAALQRFGFRDRSQSPSARAGNNSPGGGKGGGSTITSRGRGGVGAAIHAHLCLQLDRFVADFFSASTTWNPPADSSPLTYFIENCGNCAVIPADFKANLWKYLMRDAASTAAVLASSPIDTLFFVAHFANVSLDGPAPPPGDASFYGDLWQTKFFGADALDSTLYCHAVLGALHRQKRAAAESILRRYALPALVLPLLYARATSNGKKKTPTETAGPSAASVRRGVFAISSLLVGNQQPPGVNAIASSLRYFVQQIGPATGDEKKKQKIETHVAGDLETGAALSEQERSRHISGLEKLLHAFCFGFIYDFDATVLYAAKLFSAEEIHQKLFTAQSLSSEKQQQQEVAGVKVSRPATSERASAAAAAPAAKDDDDVSPSSSPTAETQNEPQQQSKKEEDDELFIAASTTTRYVAYLQCCESLVDSLRGDLAAQQTLNSAAPLPVAVAANLFRRVEPFVQAKQPDRSLTVPVRVAALKVLTALARSGAVATVPDLCYVISGLLQNELAPALKKRAAWMKKKRTSSDDAAAAATLSSDAKILELLRLLGCVLRCTSRKSKENEEGDGGKEGVGEEAIDFFDIAAEDVLSGLDVGSLPDADRLVLTAALASSLANFELPAAVGKQQHQQQQQREQDEQDQTQKEPSATEERAEQHYAANFDLFANICVDSLLALPPSALEMFGLSGGSLPRALPAVPFRGALANPLDCGRWNVVALARAIFQRFQAHNGSNSPHKISAPSKAGSAGVLKLQPPPAGFSASPGAAEFAPFLRPYRAIMLLFTLLLAKHNDVQNPAVVRQAFENEDVVAWWQMLSAPSSAAAAAASSSSGGNTARSDKTDSARDAGIASPAATASPTSSSSSSSAPTLGSELKKLLLYYDAARKGPAAVAPRTSNDTEAMHEVYVQTGRAALFVVVKLACDLVPGAIPSHLQPAVGATLSALAGRVPMPAAKAVEDDAALGQQGLEVAVKAMEWFLGVLGGKNTSQK